MKQRLFLILKLATVAILLFLIFRRVNPQKIVQAAGQMNLFLVFGALAVNALPRLFSSFQSGYLFRCLGIGFPVLTIFKINLTSSFYGFIFPGEIGSGLIKWHRLSVPTEKPAESMSVIIIPKLLSYLFLLLLGFIGLRQMPVFQNPLFGKSVVVAVAGLVLVLGILFTSKSSAVAKKLENRVSPRGASFFRIWAILRALKVRQKSVILLYTAAIHASAVLSLYLLAQALNIHLPFLTFLLTNCIVVLAQSFPATPGGLGLREGGVVIAFTVFGIAAPVAMAYSLMIFAFNVFYAICGGVWEIPSLISAGKNK